MNFLTPSIEELDITKPEQIEKFFNENEIDAVIHCAAVARMKECHENPAKALAVNTVGTANLVKVVMEKEKLGKSIKFIHMSTDGVYESTDGNYSEYGATIPYNTYGLTKLGAECAVRLLGNRYIIIRTNFFDPKNIKFTESATDAYTSKVTVDYIAKAVIKLLHKGFWGIVNVGKGRMSDFDNYVRYKKDIKPCKLRDIEEKIDFVFPKDASMDIGLWKKLEKEVQWEIIQSYYNKK